MSSYYGRGSSEAFPPVIKFLLASNVIVFLLQSASIVDIETFALWPLISGESYSSFNPLQLVSYQFLHVGFRHLFFNMLALWMFGVELEHLWGSKRFATYYLLAGVSAGVLHLIVSMLLDGGQPGAPTIGASGSIMGVLLAFGMTFPDRPIMMLALFVLIYAGLDLMNGLFNSDDGVAHFAHLGGAIGGYLLIKFGEPLFRKIDGTRSNGRMQRGATIIDADFRDLPRESSMPLYEYSPQTTSPRTPPTFTPTKFIVDGQAISQEQIDQILDKISTGGYHGLSEREKNILFEVSRQL